MDSEAINIISECIVDILKQRKDQEIVKSRIVKLAQKHPINLD